MDKVKAVDVIYLDFNKAFNMGHPQHLCTQINEKWTGEADCKVSELHARLTGLSHSGHKPDAQRVTHY